VGLTGRDLTLLLVILSGVMCEIFAIFGGNMSELFNPEIEVVENIFSKSGFRYRL
jgi:hypothetical protein